MDGCLKVKLVNMNIAISVKYLWVYIAQMTQKNDEKIQFAISLVALIRELPQSMYSRQ